MTADLAAAVDGLVSAAITLGIGVVVFGLVCVLAWAVIRGALTP